MEKFNWGIIGPGSIAKDFTEDLKHVKIPQKVTSVLSHREESAKEFADEFAVDKYYTNIEEFITNRNFDAVYIATPHTSHYEQTLACLNAGIPVLCEKPLVINAGQVKNLIAASQKNNTFLLEGMWIRFLPSINKVLELIANDEIGELVSVKASMSYQAPKDKENRYFNPDLGGGSLLDLGIYPVFLSMLLFGRPNMIKAVGKLSPEGIDETCAVLCQYDNGKHALLDSSIITQGELVAEIMGTAGTIKILSPWNEKPAGIHLTKQGGENKEFPCEWPGRGFQYEVAEVISCIEKKSIETHLYCHHFSLDVMETLDEIRQQLGVKYHSIEVTTSV
jgi:predicted dehydrogenase